MTIKQQGGVFGRNPTFNDVEIQSDLTVDNGVLKVDAANNRVGVNTETPLAPLHLVGAEFRLQDVQYPYASWFVGSTRNAYMWSVNGARFEVVADQRPLVLSATGANNVRLYANGLEHLTIQADSNVSVRNGNLIIGTSGKGIDFSATAGTGTSELFDDYEEGTWTPEITAATVGDLAVTYSVQTGLYTKIGRTVTVYASITTSSFTHTTASGIARVANLPFAVGQRGVGALVYEGITKTGFTSFLSVPNAGTTIAELYASRSGGTTSTVKITEMPTAGTVFLQFTATYTV